ncbi:MAG: hypothetical protein QOH88_1448 [Verrucomicrobiota bacterium]
MAIWISLAANAQAVTVRTVTQNGDSGAGSLRQAILDSAPNDVIDFSVGGTITISSVILQINKSLVISGPGARKLNIMGTGNAFEVFRILGGNVTISDLTIGPCKTGITLIAGTLSVNNCAVSGNIQGGGLFAFAGSTLTMNNCTLSGNQKDTQGGAALESDGTSTLTNCTIAGNTSKKNANAMIASGLGGGVSNNGGLMTLVNCTVTGNSAGVAGGGIHDVGGGTFQLTNTIVSANTAPAGPDGSGTFTSNGYNLIAKKDGITAGFTNNVNHDIVGTIAAPRDALLLSLQNNGGGTDTTAIFASGSPAVNAGAPFQATPRDQRQFIRPDASDIGACEFQGTQPVNLANISSRAVVQTGNDILIGGFIVTGNQLKKVLVRAIGPSLTLAGKLSDPVLELYSGNQLLTTNDDWVSASNKQAIVDTGAAPTNIRESAILTSLTPGSYTMQVRGFNGAIGIGVVEVYDLDRTVGSRLANISTRAAVQMDDNVLIGGFIVLGPDSLPVIVRGIGPSLSVPNPLLDPMLELHDGNGTTVASNDNWRTTQQAAIIATTVAPTLDAESAIVMTLSPGNYTTILRGVNQTIGVAVVEVYGLL